MHYRRFGRTELKLSVFSLGTMRCLSSQQNAVETICRAQELGINHFETAQGYGKSEQYLGQSLRQARLQSDAIITTKITPKPSADAMAAAIAQSLEHLDKIDCLGIHGVNTPEHLAWILDPAGCMVAVREAIAAKKIGSVGFSTHAPLNIILAAIESDQFDFVNLHYTFFFQRNWPAVEAAAQRDMGVFI
ncbi:MAG: aldo/keto reductase, partial [Cyanobacteria bacterium P01_F01_bin.42]